MHGAWLTTHLNYANLIDLEFISSLGNQGIPILPTLIQVVKKESIHIARINHNMKLKC
jgi:hypothetical protein